MMLQRILKSIVQRLSQTACSSVHQVFHQVVVLLAKCRGIVLGVDPDAQGLGLGRALVIHGLDHLARERHCETGILYVAADNAAAVGLYQALGFTTKRTDTALIRRAAVGR